MPLAPGSTARRVTVRAPGKVNLYLGVGPRRTDGYHELQTVFQAVSLYDEVTVRTADEMSVTVTGESADEVPRGSENLASAAARMLAGRLAVGSKVAISIRKRIPVAGGMAGGSADAAAALVACAQLWDAPIGRDELVTMAGLLGSDVPFTLHGGTALGTGRGELLTEVLTPGRYHWVFALAHRGLSTQQVYAEFDNAEPAALPPVDDLLAALRTGDPTDLAGTVANALQPAAVRLYPALQRTLDAAREFGALAAIVSGSGPTIAALAADAVASEEIAKRLRESGVCRDALLATGPVPGARIVDRAGS